MDPKTRNAVDAMLRDQAGLATRSQLLECGMAPNSIDSWLRTGRLFVVGRSTYRAGIAGGGRRNDLLAACLEVDGVASHWSAAWLHGLVEVPLHVDVMVCKGRSNRAGGPLGPVRVHTTTNLPADDVLQVQGVPATSVARTLLGLAAVVPAEMSESRLFDIVSKAVDERLASDPWLWWLLEQRRCRGRNGVKALESVLAARSRLGPTESWLEREGLAVFEAFGLPMPKTQRVVRRSGRFAARVDFEFDARPVVVEALGYAFHRSRQDLDRDTARAAEIQLTGRSVYQFTTDQIVHRSAWVAQVVADALGVRCLSKAEGEKRLEQRRVLGAAAA